MATTQVCKYGSYSFPFQRVKFDSAMVYNEAGTLVYTQYELVVEGVVFADEGDTTLSEAVVRMRHYLQAPRQMLKLAWTPDGGQQQILFAAGDTSTKDENILDHDIDYGPTPLALRISDIAGGLAANYEWKVSFRIKELIRDDGVRNNAERSHLLAVTRAFAFNIDQDGLTERVVTGKLQIDRRSLGSNQGPSWYRDYVYPPIPQGFHRTRSSFDVDSTGLGATFTIIDKEYANVAPSPMTTSRASISSHTPLRGGKITFTLSGEFSAPKNVPKSRILDAISTLVNSRITPQSIIETKEITASDIYERNSITFRFVWWEVRIAPLVGAGKISTQAIAPIVAPPPGTAKDAADPGTHGTAGLTEYVIKEKPYDAGFNKLSTLKKELTKTKSGVAGAQPSDLPTLAYEKPVEAASDVSKLCQQNPIIDFHHVRSYEIKNRKVVFQPKLPKAAPIIQQTAPPAIYLIDTGLMRFISIGNNEQMPKIPGPPDPKLYELQEVFVSPASPEPVGDGSVNAYVIKWRYVCVRKLGIDNDKFDTINVQIPADLRRASSKGIRYLSDATILSV